MKAELGAERGWELEAEVWALKQGECLMTVMVWLRWAGRPR